MKETYREKFVVPTYMCAVDRRLRIDKFIDLFNETCHHDLTDEGRSYYKLMETGKSLLLNNSELDIIEYPLFFDEIELSTTLFKPQGVLIPRVVEAKKDGRLIAKLKTSWIFVDMKKKRIVKPFDAYFSPCEEYYDYDEALAVREKFNLKESPVLFTKTITMNDLDDNLHVHNTNYTTWIVEHLNKIRTKETLFAPKKLCINFSREALLGETIACHSDGEGRFQFIGPDGDIRVSIRAME
ncbi:MAG: hypothetical protein HUJ63_13210 [Enterococcus sp.]|nr:hypothetical protein [Enterococcus sp.]